MLGVCLLTPATLAAEDMTAEEAAAEANMPTRSVNITEAESNRRRIEDMRRERILEDLQSDVPSIRLQAMRTAAELGDIRYIPAVMAYLDADLYDEQHLILAMRTLVDLEAQRAIPDIDVLTKHDDQNVKLTALNALSQLDALERKHHLQMLASPSRTLTASGVTNLSYTTDHQSGEELAVIVRDHSDAHTRRMAAIALGRLADDTYAEDLLEALADPDEGVRAYGALALAEMEYRPAVPYLLTALETNVAGTYIIEALRSITGDDFGYDPDANALARQEAIERGFEWFMTNGSD